MSDEVRSCALPCMVPTPQTLGGGRGVTALHPAARRVIGVLTAVLASCAAPDPAATRSTPTPPTAAPPTPTARPHGPPREAARGPVATRLTPTDVRAEGSASAAAWALFDGRAASTWSPEGDGAVVHVRFQAPQRVEAVAVRGPADGRLSLRRVVEGRAVPVEGADGLVVETGAWRRFAFTAPVDADELELDWTPARPGAPLAEVELWGSGPHRVTVADDALIDRLLQGQRHLGVESQATPEQVAVSVSSERVPGAGAFAVTVSEEPARWSRAFLVYELRGAAHWTAVPHTLNATPVAGAHTPLHATDGGLQVEEVDPSALRRGVNTVRFLAADARDAVGYRVRELRVVGVPADADRLARRSAGATALTDGDLDTRGDPRDAPARWEFPAPTTLHEVDLLLTRAWGGAVELTATRGAVVERRTLRPGTLGAGWQRLRVDPPLAPVTALSLAFSGVGEGGGPVAEVDLATSGDGAEREGPRLVVTWPQHGECVGTTGHVRGYVVHPAHSVARAGMMVDGATVGATSDDGAFAFDLANVSERTVHLRATLANGEALSTDVTFDACAPVPRVAPQSAPAGVTTDDVGAPYGQWVRAGRGALLTYGDVKIEVPAGAVDRDVRLTIRPLTASQVPRLDAGMTNVSPEGKGFRLGPHGIRFRQPLRITLPYATVQLPRGMTEADVGLFFYNDQQGRWQSVPRVRGERGARVTATSDHFTDFIAATVATPETPQAVSFNPNAMRALDPGDPSAGVTLIAAPEANNTGAATTQFPLEVPPGRRGMAPQLAITYNSEHPNGWLGVGWDLALPTIELDTRWGVPRYDGTERYTLQGAALLPSGTDADGCTVFKRRVEGPFERVRRCGGGPTAYHWEVTDQDGVVSLYGQSANAQLKDPYSGKIARWALQSVTDPFGNQVQYTYELDAGTAGAIDGAPGEPWAQLYPYEIQYTAHPATALPAHYSVRFETDTARPDTLSSARAGFDVRTRRRLTAVVVREGITLVRKYELRYMTGDFGKSLLQDIAVRGLGGASEFYRHAFAYHQAPRDADGNHRLGDPTTPWAGGLDADDRIASGASTGGGFNAFVGIGPSFCDPHVGGGAHIGGALRESNHVLADVNGDGVPDMVSDGGRIRLGRAGGGAYDGTAQQAPDAVSKGDSIEVSATAAAHLWSEAAGFSADFSWTWDWQRSLLTDVNGDGLPDLIRGPITVAGGGTTAQALAVHLNPYSFPRFAFGQDVTFAPDYLLGGFEPVPQETQVSTATADRVRALFHPVDTVVRWVAPVGGTIIVRGKVKRHGPLGQESEGTDTIRATIYQSTGILSATSTTPRWAHQPVTGVYTDCVPAPGDDCGAGLPLTVQRGDRLYFRLSGLDDPRGDTTEWDPEIEITSIDPATLPCDPDVINLCSHVAPESVAHHYRLSTDYRLADPDLASWTAPMGGNVAVQGVLEVSAAAATAPVIVSIHRRYREWPAAPSWYEAPTWQPSTVDLDSMIDSHNMGGSGSLAYLQDPSPLWAQTYTGAGNFPISVSGLSLTQGDQLVISVRLGNHLANPAGIHFTPELRYTSIAVPTGGGLPPLTSTVGACALDPVTDVRFCPLSPPLSGVDRIPEAALVRRVFPAIGLRYPELARHDGFVGGERLDPAVPWIFSSYDTPWRNWAFATWNGSADFSEQAFLYTDEQEVVRQLERLHAAARMVQGAHLLPLVQQWGQSPAGNPGTDQLVEGLTGNSWVALGADVYIGPGMMRPGRMGNLIFTPDNRIIPTGRGGLRASNAPGLRQSASHGFGPGLTIPGIGGSFSDSDAEGRLEFVDFNGDRYPDSVRTDGVQYQNPAEQTFSAPVPIAFPGAKLRHVSTHSERTGFSLGSAASVLASVISGGGSHDDTGPSIPSLGITNSDSTTKTDLLDLNGDGLPDHVQILPGTSGTVIEYRLNLGYRLGAVSRMAIAPIVPTYQGITDFDVSIGTEHTNNTSLQFGYAGIGGGPTMTTATTELRLVDLNGDGLPDRVAQVNGEHRFRVQLNNGAGFDAQQFWSLPAWPGALGAGLTHNVLARTTGLSGNVGAGVPLKIPVFVLCLVAELAANVNHGSTTTALDLHDIDGDGRVDHVLRDGSNLYVRRNETATANLLRRVDQPLGGSFEITYGREGNHVGTSTETDPLPAGLAATPAVMPTAQWVVSSVKRSDGFGHDYNVSYQYFSSGYYDRAERESYGFAHVRAIREDGSRDDLYFHNGDYYRRGRLRARVESTAAGVPLRGSSYTHLAPPAGTTGSFNPELRSEESVWYDGVTAAPGLVVASTHRDTLYDAWGNVSQMTEFGDPGASDDVTYTVGSHRDLTRWIFRADEVEARDHAGALLRRRTSTFRTDGALQSLTEHVTGGLRPDTGAPYVDAAATHTYDYDVYGNLTQATDPSGFTLTYGWDLVVHTFRAATTDSFGYSSGATWDLRFGAPLDTTDLNGHSQRVAYDEFGRVSQVYSAYDFGTANPTVSYEYGLAGGGGPVFPRWVRVRNRDSAHPGDTVDTVVFVDGLKRTVQTKRDIEVDDGAGGTVVGMAVSGAVTFDVRGRIHRLGQGVFSTAPATDFVAVSESNPSVTVYDSMSRVTSVTAPDGTVVSTAYGTESLDGVTRLTTTVTDPLSRARTQFANLRGETVAVREFNTIGGALRTLVTRYRYDPLGRLTKVTDALGHATDAEYDSRGLMVSLDNPDTGRTEYRYTLSGDLGAEESPRLRAIGDVTRYVRTWHRLDRVEVPGSTPVVHSYGGVGAGNNTAGRLKRTDDGSGWREFRYGLLGEVVEATHHVDAIGAAPAVEGTMTWSYDSFGHVQTIGYPDGASLTYAYDAGANLRRVTAVRGTDAWTYVDRITYDRFGQRASIRYGNGIETRYGYNELTRRLASADSASAGGTPLQRLRYNYNAVGNVIWRDNVVPTPPPGALNGTSYQTFAYDDLDQLTNAWGTLQRDGEQRNYTLAMQYDDVGNVVEKAQSDVIFAAPTWAGVPQAQTSYTWAYAYGGPRPHAPTVVGPRTFTYDADGNQSGWSEGAAGASRTLAWDHSNRVSSITTGASTVEFRYTGDGQRSHKHSGAGTTQYLGGFATVRNGVVATRHVYVSEERVVSTVLPDGMAGAMQLHRYYHGDHLQSTQFVTDEAGAVTEHVEYFPFGEPWVDESTSAERLPYRFTAKEIDAETGLYDFGARYYDPRQSQWVSPDPILATYLTSNLAGGVRVPANLALYTYTWNSPLRLRDPSGRVPVDVVFDGIGLALDLYDFAREPSWRNAAAVVVSAGAMVVPFVPSPRGLRMAAHLVGDVAPAARRADDVARVGNRAADVAGAGRRADHAGDAARAADRAPPGPALREAPPPQAGGGRANGGRPGPSQRHPSPERPSHRGTETSPAQRLPGQTSDLPNNPDDLLSQGYRDVSHPGGAATGHRTFQRGNDQLRWDRGTPGRPGHAGRDHYHRTNPEATGRHNEYLDSSGNPVRRGQDESHLYPPGQGPGTGR